MTIEFPSPLGRPSRRYRPSGPLTALVRWGVQPVLPIGQLDVEDHGPGDRPPGVRVADDPLDGPGRRHDHLEAGPVMDILWKSPPARERPGIRNDGPFRVAAVSFVFRIDGPATSISTSRSRPMPRIRNRPSAPVTAGRDQGTSRHQIGPGEAIGRGVVSSVILRVVASRLDPGREIAGIGCPVGLDPGDRPDHRPPFEVEQAPDDRYVIAGQPDRQLAVGVGPPPPSETPSPNPSATARDVDEVEDTPVRVEARARLRDREPEPPVRPARRAEGEHGLGLVEIMIQVELRPRKGPAVGVEDPAGEGPGTLGRLLRGWGRGDDGDRVLRHRGLVRVGQGQDRPRQAGRGDQAGGRRSRRP